MPAKGFKWNNLRELALSFYKSNETKSLDELRKEFRYVVTKISEMIEIMNEDELFKLKQRKWAGEKWPIVK